MSPRQSAALLSLPQEVLERCLALCDQHTRTTVLPLVCRTFRRLLAGPSACLWADIAFGADLTQAAQIERASHFLLWLARHGGLAKAIELDLWYDNPNELLAFEPEMTLEKLMADALEASLGACENLRLRWGGDQLVVGKWIAGARSLTFLALSAHALDVRSELASLPALVHLELSTVSDIGPLLQPACLPTTLTRLCCMPAPAFPPADGPGADLCGLPEAMLALPRLQYLDVSESMFHRDALEAALPRLTRLTSLALDKCELPDGLPSQLSLLTALRVLSFDSCIRLEGHPLSPTAWTVLGPLTNLMSLSLSNCSLLHLPGSVLSLPRMQHLYLEYNSMRALPLGPYLRSLRLLSLDWEPLLRCHNVLLSQAPCLQKLALGNMSTCTHEAEGLPPLLPPHTLLASLRRHAALREILLIMRHTHLHGAVVPVMEAILELRGLRPGLAVRAIQHDAFFVEDCPEEQAEDAAALPTAGLEAAEQPANGAAGGNSGGHPTVSEEAAAQAATAAVHEGG